MLPALITSPQGHVLIDGALPQSAPVIARHIEQLGFKTSDVKLILNSHVHLDHVGGLAELQKLSGAKVIASDIAAPFLRSGTVDATDPQFGHLPAYPGVSNVEALGKRKSVALGSLQLSAIHTPGHTPGGTSWRWQSCEEQRCLNIVYGDSCAHAAVEIRRLPNQIMGDEIRGVMKKVSKNYPNVRTRHIAVQK